MREVFRGWRRLLGVALLVMVCMFMVWWVRSPRCCDTICRTSLGSNAFHEFIVVSGASGIATIVVCGPEYDLYYFPQYDSPEDFPFGGFDGRWHWQFAGFGLGEAKPTFNSADPSVQAMTSYVVIVPHWSIIIPLTLLSAYLLCSKRRSRKPPESTNPTDEVQVTDA